MVSADDIDALLPQTQCTRCGYQGCRPYAEAIARREAEINQCPPGGGATIERLALLLQRDVLPLNPANGVEGPPLVALIDEAACIGCAKCLPPCPVDAIVGARKQMHTVLLELCTGCELCIAPCPVDCISMVPRTAPPATLGASSTSQAAGAPSALASPERPAAPAPEANRRRFLAHNERTARRARERDALLASRKQMASPPDVQAEV